MTSGPGQREGVSGDRRGWVLGIGIAVLRPLLLALTRRDWHGQHHVPHSGGCVVAVNHVSEIDPLTVAHFLYDSGRLPRFLGKVEVFDVPVLGRLLRSAGQIPVYRHTRNATKAFDAAVEAVRAGRCVIVYPEGTLTREPDLWPMVGKTGVVRIALATGCPVIPVAQWGPQEILPPYARRPHLFPRKMIRVSAGEPVDLSGLSGLAGRPLSPDLLEAATSRVMDAITTLLEDIRHEQAPPVRFDRRVHGRGDEGERAQ